MDYSTVVADTLEKDERLPELPHLLTYHSIWAHTSYHSKGFVLELLVHLYLSDFLRAGFCMMKAMFITFFLLIVSN